MMKRICDLPPELVGEILTKVPITSLGQVRSTCKRWDRLTRDWILCKETHDQFLGFITVDDKVCSLRFRKEPKDFDLSIKPVGLLNQFEIREVFHCDGLLLCVLKDDRSKLLAWNPYLGQTRFISPRTEFHCCDTYLFGYDMNRNHKMLRFYGLVFEMYEFRSNSWSLLEEVTLPDRLVLRFGGHVIVSLKGNAYFLAQEELTIDDDGYNAIIADVIVRFDFTTETFGPQPLPLPFFALGDEAVTLSSVRDQKLALLHQKGQQMIEILEIWITEGPFNADLAWTKFMNVDMTPLIGNRYVRFGEEFASFFIVEEEEKKVAVVFDMEGYEFCYELVRTDHYHTAFIIGGDDEGYYNTVNLGLAPNLWKPSPSHTPGYYPRDYRPQFYQPPLVSSSYLPSLVQLNNQPHRKRKERD